MSDIKNWQTELDEYRTFLPSFQTVSIRYYLYPMDGGGFEPFCYHFSNFNSELPLS